MDYGVGIEGSEGRVWRWIDECIVEKSAWLHHKFDNARGSDYA